MKRLGYLLIVAIVAFIWRTQLRSTSALEVERAKARDWQDEGERLRHEHERLRQLLPDAAQLTLLQREATEARELRRRIEDLKLTEWKPAAERRSLGIATPAAAVETMLWAAAGGDVAAFQKTLTIEPFARAGAVEVFESLPAESRALFSDPGHWIIARIVSGIPLNGARIMRQEQSGPDDAWVWVLLGDQQATTPAVGSSLVEVPPISSERERLGSVFIRLRRGEDGGWRLAVTRSAIERGSPGNRVISGGRPQNVRSRLINGGPMRFIAATEALNAWVLLDSAASFTFLEMQRFWRGAKACLVPRRLP